MSLINCPECEKEISDKARSCPSCGYPIAAQRVVNKSSETIDGLKTSIKEKMSFNKVTENNGFVSVLKQNVVPRVAIIVIFIGLLLIPAALMYYANNGFGLSGIFYYYNSYTDTYDYDNYMEFSGKSLIHHDGNGVYSCDYKKEGKYVTISCDYPGNPVTITYEFDRNAGMLTSKYDVWKKKGKGVKKPDSHLSYEYSQDLEDNYYSDVESSDIESDENRESSVTNLTEKKETIPVTKTKVPIQDDNIDEDSHFYGVWIGAYKEHRDAMKLVEKVQNEGFDAYCVYSSDYENLNKEPYWCVTIGKSQYDERARELAEKAIEAGYKGAYVKYTGNRLKNDSAIDALDSEIANALLPIGIDEFENEISYSISKIESLKMTEATYEPKDADKIFANEIKEINELDGVYQKLGYIYGVDVSYGYYYFPRYIFGYDYYSEEWWDYWPGIDYNDSVIDVLTEFMKNRQTSVDLKYYLGTYYSDTGEKYYVFDDGDRYLSYVLDSPLHNKTIKIWHVNLDDLR